MVKEKSAIHNKRPGGEKYVYIERHIKRQNKKKDQKQPLPNVTIRIDLY